MVGRNFGKKMLMEFDFAILAPNCEIKLREKLLKFALSQKFWGGIQSNIMVLSHNCINMLLTSLVNQQTSSANLLV